MKPTIPTTDNLYLRYFENSESGEEINERYLSVAEIDYSGAPINENGDDFDCDQLLYAYDGKKFRQIVGFQF